MPGMHIKESPTLFGAIQAWKSGCLNYKSCFFYTKFCSPKSLRILPPEIGYGSKIESSNMCHNDSPRFDRGICISHGGPPFPPPIFFGLENLWLFVGASWVFHIESPNWTIPSGNLTLCYWKYLIEIVALPIQNGDFPSLFGTVYQAG